MKVKASPPFPLSEGEEASRESDYCERLNFVFILKMLTFADCPPSGGRGLSHKLSLTLK
ncbi:hypothetical protein HMPREF9072_01803 [Capnocytophaga sp. oral taxon 324 str. F0483]|nr:hypothetical protein HMPREF9072_01803 [Capnocytophaga sp. oral taxon 324 str. F0483]